MKMRKDNELVNRIINNNLTDNDKVKLSNMFKELSDEEKDNMKKIRNEKMRERYKTDSEYREQRIQSALKSHKKRREELGIEIKPVGRPKKYNTPEEAKKANSENVKRIYYQKKTSNKPRGRPVIPLDEKIRKIEEKHLKIVEKQKQIN
jgi:hypothetical protein